MVSNLSLRRATFGLGGGCHWRRACVLGLGDVGIDSSLVGADGSRVRCGDFHNPPAKQAGQIIEDEDTNETVEKIVAWLDERKLI